jgi:hypothetical protein
MEDRKIMQAFSPCRAFMIAMVNRLSRKKRPVGIEPTGQDFGPADFGRQDPLSP